MNQNEQQTTATLSALNVVNIDEIADATRQATLAKLNEKANQLSISNFNLANDDDAFAMTMMECASVNTIWDNVPDQIQCQYLHVRQAEQFNKQTGEIEGKERTTIIDIEGGVWATNSDVASRVAKAILASKVGCNRFDPPLTLYFAKKRTMGGGECLSMTVDLDGLRLLQERYHGDKRDATA